jgi:hypothetical protein
MDGKHKQATLNNKKYAKGISGIISKQNRIAQDYLLFIDMHKSIY